MTAPTSPRIGLCLGGGGARGLAHLLVLEAFDELGVMPSAISGTSIGALIGAVYASGMNASGIHAYCKALLARRSALLRHMYSRWQGGLFRYWDPRTPSLFNSERVLELMLPPSLPKTFEDLKLPLQTVAADFYAYAPHVNASGPLLPALAASAAIPGLLTPVQHDGRVLIDGGFVNPLPFDLLWDKADIVVAVDVSAAPAEAGGKALPGTIEALVGAHQMALRSIINAKLQSARPHLLVKPAVGTFRVLDFLRQDEILAAALPIKDEVKRGLERLHKSGSGAANRSGHCLS